MKTILCNQSAFVRLLGILLAMSMLLSCRSNKDLTMLRDVSPQESLKYPVPPPPHRVGENDNLYVSIVSSNKEMNELYNPAYAGSSKNSNSSIIYNEVAGQYIYGYQADANGEIALPLIGKVAVRGLTLPECEAAIYAKAKEYLKEVSVKVRLLNYKVTVMGEVNEPGVYYNYNYNFTVMDAISMANGITNYADLDNVTVLRSGETGAQSYTLDLSKQESLNSKGYFLQPNDIVFIKPAKYKNVQLRAPVYSLVISSVATVVLFLNFLGNNN
jgi:polysaccharide export outer membrane protein